VVNRVEEGSWKEIYDWYWGAVDRWPSVFDQLTMRRHLIVAEQDAGVDPVKFASNLRASLLRQIYKGAQDCVKCPLSANRLNQSPVLDDGDFARDPFAESLKELKVPIGPTQAEIMIIAEGPGEYEQRTGLPLVSFQSLHGSRCLQACGKFESCYPAPDRRTTGGYREAKPAQPCAPSSLKKTVANREGDLQENLIQIRTERAQRTRFSLNTCGELLDLLLIGADPEAKGADGKPRLPWAWRQTWNPRMRLMKSPNNQREATLYITNAVKCRHLPDGADSATPTKSEIDACRNWLEMQLYVVQPKVLVVLGKPAYYAITGMPNLAITSDEVWGQVRESPYGIPMIVSPHPSYALKQSTFQKDPTILQNYKRRLVEILEKAKSIADGEPIAEGEASATVWDVAEATPAETGRYVRSQPEMQNIPPVPRKARAAPDPVLDPAPVPSGGFDAFAGVDLTPPASRNPQQETPLTRERTPNLNNTVPGTPTTDPAVTPLSFESRPTFPPEWSGPTEPPADPPTDPETTEALVATS
jgi:uracil-DNA glycosylase family 4